MISSTIHLLSGGLDSVTLLYDLHRQGRKVHCLMFDYKQRHIVELDYARWHCKKLKVPFTIKVLPDLGGLTKDDWIIPNRNMIFLAHAVNVANAVGADHITIGCNADDESYFPDCREPFLTAFNKATAAAGYQITVAAPYLYMPKSDIFKSAKMLGVDMKMIYTCYYGRQKPCWKCPACIKLAQAMKE